MNSKIIYQDAILELVDDFMDIGYMAEDINVSDVKGSFKKIKKSNSDRSMSIFISLPFVDELFLEEVLVIDELLSHIEVGVNCYFIFDDPQSVKVDLKSRLKKFEIVFDTHEEYGNMYGTKIVGETLRDALSKALFLISKDGAIFYIDMPDDIEKAFDLESLRIALNKAYLTYSGKGCHD